VTAAEQPGLTKLYQDALNKNKIIVTRAQVETVSRLLEDKYKWLLDPELQFTYEWQMFLILVGELFLLANQASNNIVPPYREWKGVKATEEAMQLDEPQCCICKADFGPVYSLPLNTEPALRFPCGHYVGSSCSKIWARSSIECPLCRTPRVELRRGLKNPDAVAAYRLLYGIRDDDDEGLRPRYQAIFDLQAEALPYLARGPRLVEGTPFTEMLYKMMDYLVENATGWIDVHVANKSRVWEQRIAAGINEEDSWSADDFVLRWSCVEDPYLSIAEVGTRLGFDGWIEQKMQMDQAAADAQLQAWE
jgi:hypothetical protein